MNDKIFWSKFLNKLFISSDIELIGVEFHQNKHKWLSICVYKSLKQNDSVFVEAISGTINEYSVQYEHIVIFADFNMSIGNSNLQNLMQACHLSPLIKEQTGFQFHNSTCIDNFLTNQEAMLKLGRLCSS